MTTQTTPESFPEKIWDDIKDFFENTVPSTEQKIAHFADAVTNEIKAIESNADVQKLLNGVATIAETIDPALIPMIQGIELELPKIINFVTGVVSDIDTEVAKPVEQQIVDALTKLNIIKASPSTGEAVYAGLTGTISTAIQHYVTTNNGITTPPSQLIVTSQAVHAAAA